MRYPGLWVAAAAPDVIEVARFSRGVASAHGLESVLLQSADRFAAVGETQRAAQRADR